MDYAPDKVEYNRVCQCFNLFCINDMIIFSSRDA